MSFSECLCTRCILLSNDADVQAVLVQMNSSSPTGIENNSCLCCLGVLDQIPAAALVLSEQIEHQHLESNTFSIQVNLSPIFDVTHKGIRAAGISMELPPLQHTLVNAFKAHVGTHRILDDNSDCIVSNPFGLYLYAFSSESLGGHHCEL